LKKGEGCMPSPPSPAYNGGATLEWMREVSLKQDEEENDDN